MAQSTWKWYKRLEFLKSGKIISNGYVETIDLDAPTPKCQELTDKLPEKMAVLDKSVEILNSKPEERTETDEDIFGKMVAETLKRMNLYQKIIKRKKINPMNKHFRCSINTNNSNMISQNFYSRHKLLTPKHLFQLTHMIMNHRSYSKLI